MLIRLMIALSRARRWVDSVVAAHEDAAVPLSGLALPRVADVCSAGIRTSTRLAIVEHPPRPPLERLGLPVDMRLGLIEPRGITLRDLIIIKHGHEANQSLIVHELVHVLQWRRLGTRQFLAAYGLMLLDDGYDRSPLEVMAYDVQGRFDRGELAGEIDPIVQRRTDEAVAELRSRSVRHRFLFAAARFVP